MNNKKLWIISGIIVLVLVITYFTGPVPKDPVYKKELPELSSNLSELERSIAQSEAKLPVRKDNQAHIIWHNATPHKTEYCFLYLHGFGGSYRDGYPLNKMVANYYNANIYMARWAGHGLQPQAAMKEFNPELIWESALKALAVAKQLGNKVIILSTSTGGTLAIKLAADFPDDVHAIINISPNIRDEQIGSSLLNSHWGSEITSLVFGGDMKKVKHDEDSANIYFDTIYPVEALVSLQHLLETTMIPETYQKVKCPVLTLYYYDDFIKKDWRVDIDEYPEVHKSFATPDPKKQLTELATPGTHFIGSSIKSKDYKTAIKEIKVFCDAVLEMKRE